MELQEMVTAYIEYADDTQKERIEEHLDANGYDWMEQDDLILVEVSGIDDGWNALKECLDEMESEE